MQRVSVPCCGCESTSSILDLGVQWWDHGCHKSYYHDETITQPTHWEPVRTGWFWLVLLFFFYFFCWIVCKLFIYCSHSSCDAVPNLIFIIALSVASCQTTQLLKLQLYWIVASIAWTFVSLSLCSLWIPFRIYTITLESSSKAKNWILIFFLLS